MRHNNSGRKLGRNPSHRKALFRNMAKAYRVLGNHQLVQKLFDEIAPRFAGIPGGYTRVLKLAMRRPGDSAPMAVIELTRLEEAPKAEAAKAAE